MSLDDIWEDYAADPAFATLRREGVRLCRGRGKTERPVAMLVGEAPGARENLHGKPFVGPSGILLGRLLEVAGLSWEDVYVTNAVKYWPGRGNPTPTADLVAAGVRYLRREYAAVRPDCLVAVGSVAHSALGAASLRDRHSRQSAVSLSSIAGRHLVIGDGVDYWAMYHPSLVLRNRKVMGPIVEQDWLRFGAWLQGDE